MNEATPASRSWTDSLTDKFNFDNFLGKFNVTTALVVETTLYFVGGILFGFLMKRYFKQVITALILFFLMLKGLEYIGVGSMVLDWDRIRVLTGIGPADTLDSLAKYYMAWAQAHVRQVISAVIGFLVGMKLS